MIKGIDGGFQLTRSKRYWKQHRRVKGFMKGGAEKGGNSSRPFMDEDRADRATMREQVGMTGSQSLTLYFLNLITMFVATKK